MSYICKKCGSENFSVNAIQKRTYYNRNESPLISQTCYFDTNGEVKEIESAKITSIT